MVGSPVILICLEALRMRLRDLGRPLQAHEVAPKKVHLGDLGTSAVLRQDVSRDRAMARW